MMKKVILNIDDKNLETVMHILGNLKDGLISSIDGENIKPKRKGAYTPQSGRIVSENEKPNGKYISKTAYARRLKKS